MNRPSNPCQGLPGDAKSTTLARGRHASTGLSRRKQTRRLAACGLNRRDFGCLGPRNGCVCCCQNRTRRLAPVYKTSTPDAAAGQLVPSSSTH